MDVDQAIAVGTLVITALVVVGACFALLRLARGKGASNPGQAMSAAPSAGSPYDPEVTASALFAIRSNLASVSRQIEDLEARLRLSTPPRHAPGTSERRAANSAGQRQERIPG